MYRLFETLLHRLSARLNVCLADEVQWSLCSYSDGVPFCSPLYFAFSCSIHLLFMCISTQYNEALYNSFNPFFLLRMLEEVICWREVVATVRLRIAAFINLFFSPRVCIFIFSINFTVSFFPLLSDICTCYLLPPGKNISSFPSLRAFLIDFFFPPTLDFRSTQFAVQ